MKNLLRVCLLILGIIFMKQSAEAQVSKFQAVYITNFAKYINWSEAQVTVGVVGNSPVLLELQKRTEVMKVIKISGSMGITDCNMIFIPEAQARNFSLIQSEIGALPIIIISETEDLLSLGAELAFFIEDDRLRFSINKSAVDDSKIQMSTRIWNLGKVIN